MEQLLLRAGLPLWPAERPVTLVLVAVPVAGGGNRIIREGDSAPERTAIERAAQYRGLPLAWPRAGVDIGQARAQLLAGEADSVASAAGVERARAVLVGVASAGGAEWVFGEPGRPAQGRGSLQDGINLAADTLAARYAPASTRSLATLSIRVGGVEGVRAYAGLLEYLESLSMVRQVSVEELAGGTVRLGVTLRGDLGQLRRIAALDGRLQPASDVDFTYQ